MYICASYRERITYSESADVSANPKHELEFEEVDRVDVGNAGVHIPRH